MAEQQIVVCAPVLDVAGVKFDPAQAAYSIYSKVACPHCRREMWLGERSRNVVETSGAQMICMVCAVRLGLLDADTPMERLTDREL